MSDKIAGLRWNRIYPLLLNKVERKGRTKQELDEVIYWLTGYDEAGLAKQSAQDADYATFFANAPRINPKAELITGLICGIRVEEISHPLEQQVRRLDKLVDELARGKPMEKILRK
ncbi:MAG TPA: DUF2200 domain-containing protein [Tissierellia bacterium]|nr:DUF2200 domain-containing protein [Tissierellia bacterium]